MENELSKPPVLKLDPLALVVGVFMATWFLQLNSRIEFLSNIRFEFLVGGALALICIPKYLQSPDRRTPAIHKSVLFYLAVLALYTFLSVDTALSYDIFLNRVLKFSVMYFGICAVAYSPRHVYLLLAFLFAAWLKLGQEAFVGWLSGSLVWQNQGVMRLHGSVSMLMHPNSLSGFAVGCLPFAYYLYRCCSTVAQRGVVALLGAFSLIIIVFTGSRTGYVATVLFLLYVAREQRLRVGRVVMAAAVIVAVSAILVPQDYVERFESIVTLKEKEGKSSSRRIEILQDSVAVYISNPLGVGVGAFPVVRHRMFGRWQDTHNLYLEVLTNSGPIGVAAFAYFIYAIVISLNASVRMLSGAIEAKGLSAQSSAGFLLAVARAFRAYVFIRLVLGLFGMDQYEIYWWLAAGFASAIACIARRATREDGSALDKLAA